MLTATDDTPVVIHSDGGHNIVLFITMSKDCQKKRKTFHKILCSKPHVIVQFVLQI